METCQEKIRLLIKELGGKRKPYAEAASQLGITEAYVHRIHSGLTPGGWRLEKDIDILLDRMGVEDGKSN